MAGAATWARAPRSGTGPLLALAGAAWLAGDAWSALVYAHRGPLVHALLTYPSGRTRSPAIVAVIAVAYVDGLVPEVARSPWATIALMAAVVGAAAWRWAGARGLERRSRAVPLACAVALAGALVLAAVGRLAELDTGGVATWAYDAAIVMTAVALAGDLLSGRTVRAAATGLVVDLADRQEPRALRGALARTVGDPALQIAYRVRRRVGRRGRTTGAVARRRRARRAWSRSSRTGGTPVAALVHDPAALRDETLARSVAAAVRLALANVRLQAEVAARVREVAASRRRLVEAGDEQRRRLREQLRGGAEQALGRGIGAIWPRWPRDRQGETAATLARARVRARRRARRSCAVRAGRASAGSDRARPRCRAGRARRARRLSRSSRRAAPALPRRRRRRRRTSCARRAWPTSPSTHEASGARIGVVAGRP